MPIVAMSNKVEKTWVAIEIPYPRIADPFRNEKDFDYEVKEEMKEELGASGALGCLAQIFLAHGPPVNL